MKNLIREINNKSFKVYVVFISALAISLVLFVSYRILLIKSVDVQDIQIKNTQKKEIVEVIKKEKTKDDYILEREKEIENLRFIENEMIKFIKFKGICFRYEETSGIKEDVSERIRNIFTLDEIYLMQRTIETECYQSDFMSKVNVASVILNRFKSDKFPNDIKEIITLPYQFAYGRKYVSYDTILALEYASYFGDTTNGALFFHSMEKTDKFNNYDYIFTDDAGHHFYG